MPTFLEAVKRIRELVHEKGFEDKFDDNTIFGKGLFAIMELSEALEIIKKHGIETLKVSKFAREFVSEELVDAIFYVLDLYGILYREGVAKDPDKVFNNKLIKNFAREYRYGRPSDEFVPELEAEKTLKELGKSKYNSSTVISAKNAGSEPVTPQPKKFPSEEEINRSLDYTKKPGLSGR